MKNTFTKIALLVLSLALLACVPFAVSAEETSNEVEILAKNVIYGDQIQVAFAVDATVEDALAGNVKLAYKWGEDGEVKNAVVLNPEESDNNVYKDQYPVFAIEGVAPKNLADVVYATAYTGDAPADDAEWLTYSAAEYFYARLYKDGFINKTEADDTETKKDYSRKLLYLAQLDVAKYAQVVLNYNPKELVTDYTYIFTTNENVNFDGKRTAFGYGELSLTATSELNIAGWTLTDMNGEETTLDTVILTADGVYSVEPIFGGHECADVDPVDHLCDSCGDALSVCADLTGNDGKCDICGVMNFEGSTSITNGFHGYSFSTNKDGTVYAQNTVTNESVGEGAFGSYYQIATDPANAANKVIKFVSVAASGYTDASYISLTNEKMAEADKVHVITYDFYLESSTSNANILAVSFDDTEGNNLIKPYALVTKARANAGTVTENAFQLCHAYNYNSNTKYSSGTWYKFTFVWDRVSGTYDFYISADGGATWADAYTNKEMTNTSSATIGSVSFLALNYNNNSVQYLDNIDYQVYDSYSIAGTNFGAAN